MYTFPGPLCKFGHQVCLLHRLTIWSPCTLYTRIRLKLDGWILVFLTCDAKMICVPLLELGMVVTQGQFTERWLFYTFLQHFLWRFFVMSVHCADGMCAPVKEVRLHHSITQGSSQSVVGSVSWPQSHRPWRLCGSTSADAAIFEQYKTHKSTLQSKVPINTLVSWGSDLTRALGIYQKQIIRWSSSSLILNLFLPHF